MKKLFIVLFVLKSFGLLAQLNDPAKIAKQKAEQKTNAKIDQAIDKGLNSAFDLILSGRKSNKDANTQKSKTTNNSSSPKEGTTTTEIKVDEGEAKQANNAIDKVFGQMGNLMSFDTKPKSVYHFGSSVIQKITISDKNKTETTYLKLHTSKDQPAISITFLDANKISLDDKGIIVMDLEQLAFFIFSTDKKGDKTYFGMKLKQPEMTENMEETNKSTSPQSKFTSTNTRKTIMSYTCEGYMYENENGDKSIYWVTNIRNFEEMYSYQKAMQHYNAQQKNNANDTALTYFRKQKKTIMGYDIISKKGSKTEFEMDSISPIDPFVFDASAYQSSFK